MYKEKLKEQLEKLEVLQEQVQKGRCCYPIDDYLKIADKILFVSKELDNLESDKNIEDIEKFFETIKKRKVILC